MNDDQLRRYSRQILLPAIDVAGQECLFDSKVLVVGAGGLGSSAIYYLAAAGVGEIVVFDDDEVDLSNLQRQIIHSEGSVGKAKVDSAKTAVEALNSNIVFKAVNQKATKALLEKYIESTSVVVDCSDNLDTRLMVNEVCVEHRTPLVAASAIRFEAQLCVFDFRQSSSPCYACLYDKDQTVAQSCSQNGVLGPLVGITGSFQALEVIKIITGAGENYVGYISLFDGLRSQWQRFKVNTKAECQCCSV